MFTLLSRCSESVSSFTDQFVGYVQEGMLANVESLERGWTGRDNLGNTQEGIDRRELKLPTFQHFRATVI